MIGPPSDEEKKALYELECDLFVSLATGLDRPAEFVRLNAEWRTLNEVRLRVDIAARTALVAMFDTARRSEDVLTKQLWAIWNKRYASSITKRIDDRRAAKLKGGY